MYRLLKTEAGLAPEILIVEELEDDIIDAAVKRILEHASNGDEYTSGDIEALREQMREDQKSNVGPVIYSIDNVSKMTDEEIAAAGGGVCQHCHSDQTDPSTPEMDEGYITRLLTCEVCSEETIEYYPLKGTQDD